MGAWDRRGPLPDIGRPARQGPDFGDRRPPRDPAPEGRPAREINWERRGPLSPLPQETGSGSRGNSRPRPAPDGMSERSESHRGDRRQSPATWGEGRQEGTRPPRREQPERPAPAPTAADMDMQWRERMRPDAAVKSPPDSHEGSEAPSSPAPASAAPAGPPTGRPRLNLQKRTVSDAPDLASPSTGSDSKASPFGAARPINTAAREKEVEEKRQQALREKKEAEEKAKEERRLAKEAAAKVGAETKENGAAVEDSEDVQPTEQKGESKEKQNGAADQKVPVRNREPQEPKDSVSNPKSRAAEAGNWRSPSGEQRGPRGPPSGQRGGRGGGPPRGPRGEGRPPRQNGPANQQNQAPAAAEADTAKGDGPAPDEDGWTTVPNKKGRQGRPLAS